MALVYPRLKVRATIFPTANYVIRYLIANQQTFGNSVAEGASDGWSDNSVKKHTHTHTHTHNVI